MEKGIFTVVVKGGNGLKPDSEKMWLRKGGIQATRGVWRGQVPVFPNPTGFKTCEDGDSLRLTVDVNVAGALRFAVHW
jgi:hypothetical protein